MNNIEVSPLVSVIMPTYNSVDTLDWAIASVIAQTYDNWECLVVDDGSTTSMKEIEDRVNDPRIRFYRLEQNRGRGFVREFALRKCSGKYLTFVDADDWIYPSKFASQVRLLDDMPGCALVSSRMIIVDSANNLCQVRGCSHICDLTIDAPDKPFKIRFSFAASMVRMEIARACGFDEMLRRAEDVDFLLRVLKGKKYFVSSEVNYVYRYSPKDTVNTSLSSICDAYRYQTKVLLKYANTAFFTTLILGLGNLLGFCRSVATALTGINLLRITNIEYNLDKSQVEEFLNAQRKIESVVQQFSQVPE